jgi:hypothetical protein
MTIIRHSPTPVLTLSAFGVWLGSVSLTPPSPFSALPPITAYTRLALKRFRGEPAISWFDWHFTPYHSSSANFATLVGAGLHGLLPPLHPGHGKLTRFRVYPLPLNALFRLAFASAPGVTPLTLRQRITRRFILQKARGQAFPYGHSPSTDCRHTVSGSISLPSPGCFSPFPHGTCSLSVATGI